MKSKILLVIFLTIINYTAARSDCGDKPEIEMLKTCSADTQCISVSSGCCGCTSGGTNTAINSKNTQKWTAHWTQDCKNIMCPAVMSNDVTCSAKPVCLKGVCVLK